MTSELRSDRETAVRIILDLRGDHEFGNKSPSLNTVLYGPEHNPGPVRDGQQAGTAERAIWVLPK